MGFTFLCVCVLTDVIVSLNRIFSPSWEREINHSSSRADAASLITSSFVRSFPYETQPTFSRNLENVFFPVDCCWRRTTSCVPFSLRETKKSDDVIRESFVLIETSFAYEMKRKNINKKKLVFCVVTKRSVGQFSRLFVVQHWRDSSSWHPAIPTDGSH